MATSSLSLKGGKGIVASAASTVCGGVRLSAHEKSCSHPSGTSSKEIAGGSEFG